MSNLEVDHKQFRSHSGQGAEENLVTLCFKSHVLIHGHNLSRLNQLNGDRDPSFTSKFPDKTQHRSAGSRDRD